MYRRRGNRLVEGADAMLMRRAAARVGLLAGVVAAVIVAVLTTAAALVLLNNQQATAAIFLADTVTRADDVGDPPSGMWLAIDNGTAVEASPTTPRGLPDLAAFAQVRRTDVPDIRDRDLDGTRFRIRTERRGDALVQAGLDLTSDRVQSRSVLCVLLSIGGLGLLAAALAGAWVGRRAVRPLATSLALQRRFVADASHELRTPVTLLSTRAQLVRRSLDSARTPRLTREIDRLVEDARQLTAILEDLLLAADRRRGPVQPVDLNRLIHDVAESVAASDPTVRALPATDPDTWVDASDVALRRAIIALVDNAVRHARTTVQLSARRTGKNVVVEVHDDGAGIDGRLSRHLFDRFASGSPVDADGRPHYGLGLALVSDVAARFGGTVASVPDPGGALIRLSFPAASPRDGISRGDATPPTGRPASV
jgi:signal transduction histidine kinase